MNKRLIAAVLVGSFGGLVFGFDLGALSAATQSLRSEFALSPWAFGFTVSASIWGTVVGAVLAGRLADRTDRRNLISCCAWLYTVGAIGITLPIPDRWILVLGMRFVCGIAIGGFTVGCPLYLSEIAPISLRGRVVGFFQVQVGMGVIAAYGAGVVVSRLTAPGSVWQWMLGMAAFPAVAILLLRRFMLCAGAPVLPGERSPSADPDAPRYRGDRRQQLFVRRNTRLILLATSIALFNQLSGINILLLYVLEILASAGVDLPLGHRYTVFISGLSLVVTLLGMAFVDRLGRKPLLYLGSLGMAVCLVMLGLTIPAHANPMIYLSILIAYNAFFAFSQGTVVWVYLSELFPPGLRGAGQGYGSTVHWIANAILISVFPSMQHASSAGIFYLFALMMVLQIVVIWLWYPETRGTELGVLEIPDEGGLH